MARSADIALVGIGSSDSDFMTVPDIWQYLPPAALPDLLAKGAIGSINLQYFGTNGCLVPCDFNNSVIGLTLDEMRKIPRVVGIAGGPAKVKAIDAALRAQLIDVLVTDHVTAIALLGKSRS
jgi:deoxyribonucleoside regulator